MASACGPSDSPRSWPASTGSTGARPALAASRRWASANGAVSSCNPCTSSTGQRTRGSVANGAMSSKRAPITRCTWCATAQPSGHQGRCCSCSQRRISSAGCAKADRLTTARMSSRCVAASSAAAAPTEWPTTASRVASTAVCPRSQSRPVPISSAKRGIELNSSSSLAPWQRASGSSTAKPAACSGGTAGSMSAALAPQPCISSTAGAGPSPGPGTNQAKSDLPPAVRRRTVSAARPRSAGVRWCASRVARSRCRMKRCARPPGIRPPSSVGRGRSWRRRTSA